jgi:hypothetical protein
MSAVAAATLSSDGGAEISPRTQLLIDTYSLRSLALVKLHKNAEARQDVEYLATTLAPHSSKFQQQFAFETGKPKPRVADFE